MYFTPAESRSDNSVSEPMPSNEIIMSRISFKAKCFKGRLVLIKIFLDAINQMLWHGEVEILVPHENMPQPLYDAYLAAQRLR